MSSSLLLTTLRSALLAGVALAVAGCCEIGVICVEVVSAEDGGTTDERDGAPPPLATAGCNPSAIESQNGGACAECTAQSGADVRVCGDVQTADCINQENAYGERCQRCVTPDGDILFDDCAVAPDDVGAARCEQSPGDPSAPEQGDSECTVCFDERGSVVSQTCGPTVDECYEVDDGARICVECTRDGIVVSFQCENVNLDPSFCEAYSNEAGTCVDCYADSGALLSHQCSLAEDQPIFTCVETVDPAGLSCVQCFDQFGNVEDIGCEPGIPEARSCQLLSYSTQTCVVCVDDFGEPVFTDCTPTPCDNPDGAACPTQSQCYFEGNEQMQLCRTCFFDDNTGASETACLTDTDLVCTGAPASDLPPDPNQPNPGGEPAPPEDPTQECLYCTDAASGVEVYRNCGANGPSQPPVCVDDVDPDGNVCTFCYDGNTGEALYSSCGDTCYVTGERMLTSQSGEPLVSGNAEAIATCYRCGAEGTDQNLTESDFAAICSLPQECAGPDGFVDGTEECPMLFSLLVAPRQCENGWDGYQAAPGSEEELLAVLSWALSERSLALAGAAVLAANVDSSCAAGCAECARGDLLEIQLEDVSFELAAQAFGPNLVGCQTDVDCPANAMCIDGLCGF